MPTQKHQIMTRYLQWLFLTRLIMDLNFCRTQHYVFLTKIRWPFINKLVCWFIVLLIIRLTKNSYASHTMFHTNHSYSYFLKFLFFPLFLTFHHFNEWKTFLVLWLILCLGHEWCSLQKILSFTHICMVQRIGQFQYESADIETESVVQNRKWSELVGIGRNRNGVGWNWPELADIGWLYSDSSEF